MIYLFHGSDYILSRVALKELEKSYQKSDIAYMAGATFDFETFRSVCETRPMFSKKRLLVVEGSLARSILNAVLDYLDDLPEYVDVAFWQDQALKKGDSLIRALKEKEGVINEFKSFLKEDIFPFLEAIASKNKKLAFMELLKLQKKGVESAYILRMISWQFRNIMLLSLNCQTRENLHPFVLAKAKVSAKLFKRENLVMIYSRILDYEIALKTGTPEEKLLVQRLLWEIL